MAQVQEQEVQPVEKQRQFFATLFHTVPATYLVGGGMQSLVFPEAELGGEVDRFKQLLKKGRVRAFYVAKRGEDETDAVGTTDD